MLKNKLFEDLYDKVPAKGNIVIFGACKAGEGIMNDLKIYKPETKVIGFIDNFVKGSFNNLPVWRIKEFIDLKLDCQMVIMSTMTEESKIMNIFDIFDIPALKQTPFVSAYYRDSILSNENCAKVLKILETDKDKELYENIFNIRKKIKDISYLKDYHYDISTNKFGTYHVYKIHYLEKINKNAIKILFDLGLYDGFNVIAFEKFLPNLQKIYGFDAIYDLVKRDYIEDFINNERLEVVPFALGDCSKKINFYINLTNPGASFGKEISSRCFSNSTNYEHRTVDVTTIDKFCTERNVFPDFIKMDIEGAELSALKGGMEIIKKYRPQLAISIYHSSEDFVNIPLYLSENLENYKFRIGHYSDTIIETVLYAIPNELT